LQQQWGTVGAQAVTNEDCASLSEYFKMFVFKSY